MDDSRSNCQKDLEENDLKALGSNNHQNLSLQEAQLIKANHLSESDCEVESAKDNIDTVIAILPKPKNLIYGFHLMPTCLRDPSLEPPKKQLKLSAHLHNALNESRFFAEFKNNWHERKALNKNDVELITDPFRVCVVQNLLQDDTILTKVREEFNELEWNKRSLDLYELFQSCDLAQVDSKYINVVYNFLKEDVRQWVERLTGLELVNTSATCSVYGDTDYLLVHDDQQEDRMIAFVLYLTGPGGWSQEDGGALQLFSKDQSGQPDVPVRDIIPSHNQLVFFQVSNDSYHQVAEVTNKNDCRLSINGWFHTRQPPTFEVPVYHQPDSGLFSQTCLHPKTLDIDLEAWICPEYLEADTMSTIQEHIEEQSEISLNNFFRPEAFEEILQTLSYKDLIWKKTGPPNRRLYDIILEENIPQLLERFLGLFQSNQMFQLLKQYTDLDIIDVRYELQRWTPGSYALLTDYGWMERKELDLVLYLGVENVSDVVGGRTMYVATDEKVQQALITLEPEQNNLNIVFRDSARITKYVSKYSNCKCYYILICSYSE